MLLTASGQPIHSVAVLYGGWSHETNYTAHALVISALQSLGIDVTPFDIRTSHFISQLQSLQPDAVFPTNQGANSADGKIQGLLEILDLPYVGCGVCASSVGVNKLASKLAFRGMGILTPNYVFCPYKSQIPYTELVEKLGSPLVVKPLMAGSSFGVDIIEDEKTFAALIPPKFLEFGDLIIEEFIDGKGVEYTIGIIEDDIQTIQLPVCEIRLKTNFLSLNTKYTAELTERIAPAPIEKHIAEAMQHIALKIHTTLGCHSMSRIDLIVRNDQMYILEVNTLPGLLDTSFIPRECRAIGISYEQMIAMLVKSAFKRRPMEVPKIYDNWPQKLG